MSETGTSPPAVPLAVDPASPTVTLPNEEVVAKADVAMVEINYYRAAAPVAPGELPRFEAVPQPRIRLRMKDGSVHLAEFANGGIALTSANALRVWLDTPPVEGAGG